MDSVTCKFGTRVGHRKPRPRLCSNPANPSAYLGDTPHSPQRCFTSAVETRKKWSLLKPRGTNFFAIFYVTSTKRYYLHPFHAFCLRCCLAQISAGRMENAPSTPRVFNHQKLIRQLYHEYTLYECHECRGGSGLCGIMQKQTFGNVFIRSP